MPLARKTPPFNLSVYRTSETVQSPVTSNSGAAFPPGSCSGVETSKELLSAELDRLVALPGFAVVQAHRAERVTSTMADKAGSLRLFETDNRAVDIGADQGFGLDFCLDLKTVDIDVDSDWYRPAVPHWPTVPAHGSS